VLSIVLEGCDEDTGAGVEVATTVEVLGIFSWTGGPIRVEVEVTTELLGRLIEPWFRRVEVRRAEDFERVVVLLVRGRGMVGCGSVTLGLVDVLVTSSGADVDGCAIEGDGIPITIVSALVPWPVTNEVYEESPAGREVTVVRVVTAAALLTYPGWSPTAGMVET